MTTDTDKASDKLVDWLDANCHFTVSSPNDKTWELREYQLTAFRAAIIADLCGDVEPSLCRGTKLLPYKVRYFGTPGMAESLGYTDDRKDYFDASTVAALKAQVAELEKDAARLEFVCNSPNRMVERESGLWRVYEDVAPADHPTSVWQGITPRWHVTSREAIDAAITAALTKGQP